MQEYRTREIWPKLASGATRSRKATILRFKRCVEALKTAQKDALAVHDKTRIGASYDLQAACQSALYAATALAGYLDVPEACRKARKRPTARQKASEVAWELDMERKCLLREKTPPASQTPNPI